MEALEFVKFVESKTLEELRPKGNWSGLPAERAPYALKILNEKIRVVEKMRELEEAKRLIEESLKKLQEEYDALFGL